MHPSAEDRGLVFLVFCKHTPTRCYPARHALRPLIRLSERVPTRECARMPRRSRKRVRDGLSGQELPLSCDLQLCLLLRLATQVGTARFEEEGGPRPYSLRVLWRPVL
jgi:hypothetical protein